MDRRDRRSPSRSRSPRRDAPGDRHSRWRDPSPQRRDPSPRRRDPSPRRREPSPRRRDRSRDRSPPRYRDDGSASGRHSREDYNRGPRRDDSRGESDRRRDLEDPRERDLWKTKEERRREPSAGSDVPREARRPLPGPSRGPARGPDELPRPAGPAALAAARPSDAPPRDGWSSGREGPIALDGPGRAGGGRGGGGAGGAGEEEGGGAPKPPFEKPDFGLSGALAEDAGTGNVYNGVLLKFSEPPEARPPTQRWRLHVFKGDTQLEEPLHVHRQSAYLAGRDRRVADIPTDHPSCSSQHAVLQYRLVELPRDPGDMAPPERVVKPYVIDLESTNGTFVNGERIPGACYYELKAGDVLKFGLSSREYVLLHDEMVGGGRAR